MSRDYRPALVISLCCRLINKSMKTLGRSFFIV